MRPVSLDDKETFVWITSESCLVALLGFIMWQYFFDSRNVFTYWLRDDSYSMYRRKYNYIFGFSSENISQII